MPQNLELKIKTADHKNIIDKLITNGAEFKGKLNQKDIYYNYSNGLLKLRIENDLNQLIKYKRDESGNNRWSDYEILNLSGKNVEEYLGDLFFTKVVVEKTRDLYIYSNSRIHLDCVKNLGNFLEIETIVTSTQKDAEKRFEEIVNILNLDVNKQLRKSYRDLMLNT